MPVLRIGHADTSESRDSNLPAPVGAVVGGAQHRNRPAALLVAVVELKHRHYVDKVFVAERNDLVTDRLVVLTRIKDRPRGLPAGPAVRGTREPGGTAESRRVQVRLAVGALVRKNQPIPDRVHIIRVILIGGNGLLVIEDGRVGVALQGGWAAPDPIFVGGRLCCLADENRVVEVFGVVERQRYLIGVAVGGEADPRIRASLVEIIADALGEVGQITDGDYREVCGTIRRDGRSQTARAAVRITILLVNAEEIRAISVFGAGRIDVEPGLNLRVEIQRAGLRLRVTGPRFEWAQTSHRRTL